jgi:hypothetical protein
MFGYFRSAGQITRLLAPALAAVTMSVNLWLPFWIGVGLYGIALPAVNLLPDTRKHSLKAAPQGHGEVIIHPDETQSLLPTMNFPVESSIRKSLNERSNLQELATKGWNQARSELRDYIKLFQSSRNVSLSLLIFLVTSLSDNNLNVLLQYVSKRYDWTISQAAYLFSLKAGLNVILYTLIVPLGLQYLIHAWKFSCVGGNLWATKVSIVVLCLGCLAIGLSFKIWMLITS